MVRGDGVGGRGCGVTDPAPIDDGIRRVLARLGLRDLDLVLRIRSEWETLAGDPWARTTQPVSLIDGVLRVEAAVPGLVSTLRYAAPALVGRLRRELDTDRIAEVTVVPPAGAGSLPSRPA